MITNKSQFNVKIANSIARWASLRLPRALNLRTIRRQYRQQTETKIWVLIHYFAITLLINGIRRRCSAETLRKRKIHEILTLQKFSVWVVGVKIGLSWGPG